MRRRAVASDGVQMIQRDCFFIERIEVLLRHGILVAARILGYLLDQVACGVAQGSRAVENGRDEGVFGIFQQQLGSLELDVVIQLVVLALAGEIVNVFVARLRLGGK